MTLLMLPRRYCRVMCEDKVFASGGSAGGPLMGAVINQAPHLYRAIGCRVPFLDVLTTMLDEHSDHQRV